jgi:hypothetical protein
MGPLISQPAQSFTDRIRWHKAQLRRLRRASRQLLKQAEQVRAQMRARRSDLRQVITASWHLRDTLAHRPALPADEEPPRLGHPLAPRAATTRARAGDLAYFWAWAAEELALARTYPVPYAVISRFISDHLRGLPPATEAALLARCRQKLPGGKARPGPHSPATIERRLVSLSLAHRRAGVPDPYSRPVVRRLLARACRTLHREASPGKRPAAGEVLDALLATCDESLAGRRDRALLLFGAAAGGLHRSEVATVRLEDLRVEPGGFRALLRRVGIPSSRRFQHVEIHGPAAAAVRGWIEAAGLGRGPLFRSLDRWSHVGDALSGRGVAEIVKRRAALAGYDPTDFGGRSLRRHERSL